MSDTAQGPGWWQATDGKWYAPQRRPSSPSGLTMGQVFSAVFLALWAYTITLAIAWAVFLSAFVGGLNQSP